MIMLKNKNMDRIETTIEFVYEIYDIYNQSQEFVDELELSWDETINFINKDVSKSKNYFTSYCLPNNQIVMVERTHSEDISPYEIATIIGMLLSGYTSATHLEYFANHENNEIGIYAWNLVENFTCPLRQLTYKY